MRGRTLVGEQGWVGPHWLAVGTPINVQRPARQLFTGVPLALAKVQKATLAVLVAQFMHQIGGKTAFGWAQGIGVPFWCVAVAVCHKSGLAAHRQAHVASYQFRVHRLTQRHDVGPLFFGVRLGDTGRLVNAGDLHVVGKFHLALVRAAFNGGSTRRLGRAGQRNMAFTGQQTRGGVQPHPAGAGQIDLAPGVQVGKVNLGAAGAVERFHVGFQLNQIARHKARRQAAMAQQVNHQPSRIAARTRTQSERFFRRLHARLHADGVVDGFMN